MSFLYPLFLLAGLAIAIPVLIHLFNLRRYKTVYFPSTRFLKTIQLRSQKQSQIRYKWLLALRILFILSLVLAFAQPLFTANKKKTWGNRLQIIYVDNSNSMAVKKGARSLLDIAKESARQQIKNSPANSRFILLTNDKPVSYQPMPAEKALAALNKTEQSAVARPANHVFSTIQSLIQSESASGADLYYYSDFQKNSFPSAPENIQLAQINFYGVPVQAKSVANIFIDTAFFTAPVLQSQQNNRLIVKTRLIGRQPSEASVMQLSINGQVKTAATPVFNDRGESIDTLSFQVNNAGWNRIMLTVNDASVRFDDTFRIAARSTASLSALVLNEQQPNPYIQAAFKAYSGFRMEQKSINDKADWKQYNLIVLNDLTNIPDQLAKQINAALQQGQSICIFPGKTSDIATFNDGLRKIADIRIEDIDTAVQAASNLQQGSDLVRDLFEQIPQNVQLPVANWHYNIHAGLTANQQSILSFRNGNPLLAQYTPSQGKLYLLATSANLSGGNFQGSYFFVPFLYQMTAQAKSGDIYALTAGKQQPAYLPLNNANERNMVHIRADGLDLIPPQRPHGSGLDVYVSQVIQQPGFYILTADNNDTAVVALNQDKTESALELWDLNKLREGWKGSNIHWQDISVVASKYNTGASFPLWKVCVILALLMLAAESYLLAAGYRKQTVAPQ